MDLIMEMVMAMAMDLIMEMVMVLPTWDGFNADDDVAVLFDGYEDTKHTKDAVQLLHERLYQEYRRKQILEGDGDGDGDGDGNA